MCNRKEDAMKILMILVAVMVTMIGMTPVLASSDPEAAGSGLLVFLFLGFIGLIVAFQLIPSLILFGSMIKGLFGAAESHPLPKSGGRVP
jgi:hypothetical protein